MGVRPFIPSRCAPPNTAAHESCCPPALALSSVHHDLTPEEIQRRPLNERRKRRESVRSGGSSKLRNRLHKKASRRLNRTSSAMTLKSMITTKAIAFPSGGFPSMWTHIELHSSVRKLQQNNRPWLPPFNSVPAMHEAQQHFGCAALARSNSHLWMASNGKKHDPFPIMREK
jgi:hypothetical protein